MRHMVLRMADSAITSPALRELRRKLTLAAFRRIWRQAKSPVGAVMALFAFGLMCSGIVPMIGMTFLADEGLRDVPMFRMLPLVLPLMLYLIAAATIGLDLGKSLTELHPAELQFVLAGPFSDRQILTYRMATLGLSMLPMSLFFGVFATPYTGNFFSGFVGVGTTAAFIMSLGIMRTLVTPRISAQSANILRYTCLLTMLWPSIEIGHRLVTASQPLSIENIGLLIHQTCH